MNARFAYELWESTDGITDPDVKYSRANAVVRLLEEEKISLVDLVPNPLTRSRLVEHAKLFMQTYGEYK